MTTTTSLAPLLEHFFTQRLMQQPEKSFPHPVGIRDVHSQVIIHIYCITSFLIHCEW